MPVYQGEVVSLLKGTSIVGYIAVADMTRASDLIRSRTFDAFFISVQNHYNLIMREDEREMQPLCREDNIAQTPYSALASGKLAKRPGETSKRQKEDAFMHFKYDATAGQDNLVVERVVELADR